MDETNPLSTDAILSVFRTYSGVYEKEAVEAAIACKVEIIPRLIGILQTVAADPEPYIENEDLYDHIYAIMLLGHLKITAVHRIIVDLFSLPNAIPHDLFGDIGIDNLPMILLRTSGGAQDLIRDMALDRAVDDYCRGSALHAMAYAVADGTADRDETLAFFNSLFAGDEADPDSDFWGFLACNILELYPEESMDVIKRGYEAGLISPGMVGYDSFEMALKEGREKTLERLQHKYQRDSMDDIHRCMSWWACFQPEKASRPDGDMREPFFDMPGTISTRVQQKQNAKAKKKKRKQAKASRRKNRR